MATNTASSKKAIEQLNDLIEICKDGEQGFRTASEGLADDNFRMECLQYAEQRRQFARELQEAVRNLGGDPEHSGSVAGSLHRGWINIKAAVTGKDEAAIIAECERGEDAAKEAYEKAIGAYLPPSVSGVIQMQYEQVKKVHDRFSLLQKAQRAA
jgi:uncharacterized protein (TIGR02284 family)